MKILAGLLFALTACLADAATTVTNLNFAGQSVNGRSGQVYAIDASGQAVPADGDLRDFYALGFIAKSAVTASSSIPGVTTPTVTNDCAKFSDTKGTLADVGAPCGTSNVVLGTTSYAVTAAPYNAKCDGTTDDSTAIQAAITAAQLTGGIVTFPAGKCRINSQLAIPNDGASVPNQNPIILQGSGPVWYGHGGTPSTGGTILDMRSAATDGKLISYGTGYLEIRNLSFTDGGTNSNPYVFVTNTTVHIHDNVFIGNSAKNGVQCNQDAIVLGGTAHTFGGTPSDSFQGYGTVIRENFFDRIRRAVYGRVDVNGIVIRDNHVYTDSGSNLANDAAILLDGGVYTATGNTVAGNLLETTGYTYGIKLANGSANSIIGNDCFDAGAGTVACVRIETTSTRDLVTGSLAGGSPSIYLSDAGGTASGTEYLSTDQGHASQLGPATTFTDGAVWWNVDKMTLTTGTMVATPANADNGLNIATTAYVDKIGTTLGDIQYWSANGTRARLAGNTAATPAVLMQTGNGTVSAAPSWSGVTGTGSVVLATSPTVSGLTVGGTLTVSSSLAVGANTAALLQGSVRVGRTAVADTSPTLTTTGGTIVGYTSITAARTITFATSGNTAAPQFLIIKDESGNADGTKTISLSGPTIDGAASPQVVVNSAFGVRFLYCTSSTVCLKIL